VARGFIDIKCDGIQNVKEYTIYIYIYVFLLEEAMYS